MSKENKASDELLPCPFCGGKAKLSNYRVAEDAMGCHVACTKCLVQTDVFEDAYTPFEQAIRAWNTRSKPVAGEQEPVAWRYSTGDGWDFTDDRKRAYREHDARNLVQPLYASPQPESVITATHRHKKRGTEYALIGIGKMQTEDWLTTGVERFDGYDPGESVDMREVAVYRSVENPDELWVRPREEFQDGRFERIEAALKEA